MKYGMRCLALGLSVLLVACGESTPQQTSAPQIESASTDPKYQNPLLNMPPAQFAAVLAECGKVLYGADAPTDAKCREDVKGRAVQQGVTLSDANLDEPLVHDRYQFSTSSEKK
ncbi:MAG: hypothetical protein ACRC6G_05085 [Deefgea sp.]